MNLKAFLRTMLRRPRGGAVTHRPDDSPLIALSPGRPITDPDEAEALGLTANARTMRANEEPTQ
ncbi:hypothetical protein [Streptomyces sp. NRRL S-1022]|uniref:hypothetical protein n=1 Tax=Streptomyces sp. NRRL S-1022 TaxID=1463880 RepID=UPI00131E1228|nr:hypothetical protein [Streptomyces sp. NRRL S-1022]